MKRPKGRYRFEDFVVETLKFLGLVCIFTGCLLVLGWFLFESWLK